MTYPPLAPDDGPVDPVDVDAESRVRAALIAAAAHVSTCQGIDGPLVEVSDAFLLAQFAEYGHEPSDAHDDPAQTEVDEPETIMDENDRQLREARA